MLIKRKILFVVNVDWFFISHRLVIAEKALAMGYEVMVACEDSGRSSEITAKGIEFFNIPFTRSGVNLADEIRTILRLFFLYNTLKPDIVHHVTMKPVVYGSIIARILHIRGVVNSISGLGFTFINSRSGLVRMTILQLMKVGFRRNNLEIIFQNDDDRRELVYLGVINSNKSTCLIKGSGVDLIEFYETPFPDFSTIKVLLSSRMLWHKGVKEFCEAAILLKERYYGKVQFILAGMLDPENKADIPLFYLEKICDGDYINWIGHQSNILGVIQNSHIVVLPSYREGMPKSLLEACAVGRAIVTTDAVGCKETVDEGINGFKVPVESSSDLARALERLFDNHELITVMGHNSRAKAEKEFDVIHVVDKHMEVYKKLLDG